MIDVVGVRFRRAGKVYYFDRAGLDLKLNDQVVVETTHGLEIGTVIIAPRQMDDAQFTEPLKPVIRKAEPEDIRRDAEQAAKQEEALVECGRLIAKFNLPMKLLTAEYNLDGSKLTFCFSAEERVDFRELVRELTRYFKTRVELRQIGPRDQAKIVGGFGRCGRPLCCMSFLTEFDPISIKMAKDQELPLNPMKISGTCGRLLCCLAYEDELYKEIKERLPRLGQHVNTPKGPGKVVGLNPLKEIVTVLLEDETTGEFPAAEITPGHQPQPQPQVQAQPETQMQPEFQPEFGPGAEQ